MSQRQLIGRTTCLYCEIDGITTELIPSPRGGFCPEHGDPAFIEFITATLPDPDPLLLTKGIPHRRPA